MPAEAIEKGMKCSICELDSLCHHQAMITTSVFCL